MREDELLTQGPLHDSGGCGVTCAAGLVCKNNFCVPPPPPPNPPPGDGEPEYSVTTDYPPYYPPAYVDPAAVFEG